MDVWVHIEDALEARLAEVLLLCEDVEAFVVADFWKLKKLHQSSGVGMTQFFEIINLEVLVGAV